MRKSSLIIDISAIVLISVLLILGLSYGLYYLANYKVVYNYLVITLSFVLFVAWRVSKFIKLGDTKNVSPLKAVYISFFKPLLLLIVIFILISVAIVLSLLLNLY